MSVTGSLVVKRTRRNAVLTYSREHYLRLDIPCPLSACPTCAPLFAPSPSRAHFRLPSPPPAQCFIPDVPTATAQVDLLTSREGPLDGAVVVLQTVLARVEGAKKKVFEKFRKAMVGEHAWVAMFNNENHRDTFVAARSGEGIAARDLRAVVVAAGWLAAHGRAEGCGKGVELVVVTQEAGEKVAKMMDGGSLPAGVRIMAMREVVEQHAGDAPRLGELYVETPDAMEVDGTGEGGKMKGMIYRPHLGEALLRQGVAARKYVQGTYHLSSYNIREASISGNTSEADAEQRSRIILFGREDQNRAVEGDLVVVKLYPKEQWRNFSDELANDDADEDDEKQDKQPEEPDAKKPKTEDALEVVPTGYVVGILRRNWRPLCGSVEHSYSGGDSALIVPVDRRMPKVKVRSQRLKELVGKKVLVAMDTWSRNSVYPWGHIVREIGSSGDKESETEVLLLENQIPVEKFSDAAMACLPAADWHVTEDMIKNRWDLRDRVVCSVDPPGCTDIDDALHCRELPDGNYEVGIHIADVTAFVRHDSTLDKEAAVRSTTVYLVDRRIEMLPSLLSGNLCSMRGGVERLGFSVLLTMDAEGNVLDQKYGRSVIKSSCAMTYAEAQDRIDASRALLKKNKKVTDPVNVSLLDLAKIAKSLRKRREAAGALSLASPEVKFKIAEATDEITDVSVYEIRETNRMVEEYMLLANIKVAEKLLQHFPQCSLLRRHPLPSKESFEPLIAAAKSIGVDLDTSSSKALNASLDAAAARFQSSDEYTGTLLRILTTRCMTQAIYCSSGSVASSEFLHYGLAVPIYTHFTSPIRRYADVVVHRLLSAAIGYSALAPALQSSARIDAIASVINERHRAAQYASRASINLHTVLLFKDKPATAEGRILRVMKNGIVVLVPKFGVEGTVNVGADGEGGGEEWVYDAVGQRLWKKGSAEEKFEVAGRVRVRIGVESVPERRDRVTFELV